MPIDVDRRVDRLQRVVGGREHRLVRRGGERLARARRTAARQKRGWFGSLPTMTSSPSDRCAPPGSAKDANRLGVGSRRAGRSAFSGVDREDDPRCPRPERCGIHAVEERPARGSWSVRPASQFTVTRFDRQADVGERGEERAHRRRRYLPASSVDAHVQPRSRGCLRQRTPAAHAHSSSPWILVTLGPPRSAASRLSTFFGDVGMRLLSRFKTASSSRPAPNRTGSSAGRPVSSAACSIAAPRGGARRARRVFSATQATRAGRAAARSARAARRARARRRAGGRGSPRPRSRPALWQRTKTCGAEPWISPSVTPE